MVVVLSEIESKVREIKEGGFNFREKDKVRVFMGERYEKMNNVLLGFISPYFSLYSHKKNYGDKGFGGKDDEYHSYKIRPKGWPCQEAGSRLSWVNLEKLKKYIWSFNISYKKTKK